ncbi:hypothetical protein PM082_023968 [Marasmius tenuissimus]|nr:hypothetical protein PM082_023968 [Marasmius tenuissimus]
MNSRIIAIVQAYKYSSIQRSTYFPTGRLETGARWHAGGPAMKGRNGQTWSPFAKFSSLVRKC